MENSSINIDHRKFDTVLNTIRFNGLAHLMNLDYTDLTPDEADRECKKLAIEIKILSGRLMAIAFDGDDSGVLDGRQEKRKC